MMRFVSQLWQRGPFTKVILVIIGVEAVMFLIRVAIRFSQEPAGLTKGQQHLYAFLVQDAQYLFIVGLIAAVLALVKGELDPRD